MEPEHFRRMEYLLWLWIRLLLGIVSTLCLWQTQHSESSGSSLISIEIVQIAMRGWKDAERRIVDPSHTTKRLASKISVAYLKVHRQRVVIPLFTFAVSIFILLMDTSIFALLIDTRQLLKISRHNLYLATNPLPAAAPL